MHFEGVGDLSSKLFSRQRNVWSTSSWQMIRCHPWPSALHRRLWFWLNGIWRCLLFASCCDLVCSTGQLHRAYCNFIHRNQCACISRLRRRCYEQRCCIFDTKYFCHCQKLGHFFGRRWTCWDFQCRRWYLLETRGGNVHETVRLTKKLFDTDFSETRNFERCGPFNSCMIIPGSVWRLYLLHCKYSIENATHKYIQALKEVQSCIQFSSGSGVKANDMISFPINFLIRQVAGQFVSLVSIYNPVAY